MKRKIAVHGILAFLGAAALLPGHARATRERHAHVAPRLPLSPATFMSAGGFGMSAGGFGAFGLDGPADGAVGRVCGIAARWAEARHDIPRGTLLAIAQVESGRRDPESGRITPWPWTINVDGQGRYFATKQEAVAWVRQAQHRGTASIDTGCLQVNLMYHADAFASLDEAFDPFANADYAARFLRDLWSGPAARDWVRAVGFYHSRMAERAEPYRRQVAAALHGLPPALSAGEPAAGSGGNGYLTAVRQIASGMPETGAPHLLHAAPRRVSGVGARRNSVLAQR